MDTNEDTGEDFKNLLEQYKHMQEELDQIRSAPKRRSLVDDVIDDSFVDVPLDDNLQEQQDDLDAAIRRLELNFSQANSIGTDISSGDLFYADNTWNDIPSISQTIPTTYGNSEQNYDNYSNEQPFFGLFEPFKIKASLNKVRTLSELSQIDLASRGLSNDNSGMSKTSDSQSKSVGKAKTKRKPSKSARQRMKRRAALRNQSGEVSSNDVYEEFNVRVNTQSEENHRYEKQVLN